MELYKKHRPTTFAEVIGNSTTIRALQNMVERKTVPHAILISGPSGCGKTTIARILKTELECGDIDFKEMNIADFRGVDTIRDISRKINISATGGKVRIWLLDEVHQMSKDGQNAILKILEDTPRHVYFILCTTDPQKIIPTIKTRCCQLTVAPLSDDELGSLLKRTCKQEKEQVDEEILEDIISNSDGSSRKALVMLEKVISLPKDSREDFVVSEEADKETIDLCRALLKKAPWTAVAKILKTIKAEPESVRYAVLGYMRAILLSGQQNKQAAIIMDVFSGNFYDSKDAGLTLACFEIIVGL